MLWPCINVTVTISLKYLTPSFDVASNLWKTVPKEVEFSYLTTLKLWFPVMNLLRNSPITLANNPILLSFEGETKPLVFVGFAFWLYPHLQSYKNGYRVRYCGLSNDMTLNWCYSNDMTLNLYYSNDMTLNWCDSNHMTLN